MGVDESRDLAEADLIGTQRAVGPQLAEAHARPVPRGAQVPPLVPPVPRIAGCRVA